MSTTLKAAFRKALAEVRDRTLREAAAEAARAEREAEERGRNGVLAVLGEMLVKAMVGGDTDDPGDDGSTISLILKAREGLTKKVITNKLGRKQTVYVRQGESAPAEKKPGKREQSTAKRAQAKQALSTALADPSKLTHDDLPGLKTHIESLTVADLKDAAKSLAQKVGGKKAELAMRVADALRAKAKPVQPATEPADRRSPLERDMDAASSTGLEPRFGRPAPPQPAARSRQVPNTQGDIPVQAAKNAHAHATAARNAEKRGDTAEAARRWEQAKKMTETARANGFDGELPELPDPKAETKPAGPKTAADHVRDEFRKVQDYVDRGHLTLARHHLERAQRHADRAKREGASDLPDTSKLPEKTPEKVKGPKPLNHGKRSGDRHGWLLEALADGVSIMNPLNWTW